MHICAHMASSLGGAFAVSLSSSHGKFMRTTLGVKVTSALPHKIFNRLLASSYHFHSLCLLILMPYHLYFLCPDSLCRFFSLRVEQRARQHFPLCSAIRYCNELEKCYFFSQFIVRQKYGTVSHRSGDPIC